MTSDEELFRQWQRGHVDAFETLVQRYQRPLLSHLYNLVGSAQTAEDLVQETFVRLVREAQSYRYPRPFFPWLYTIARNLALKELSRAYHRHVELGMALHEAPSGEPDPEEAVERWEQRHDLQRALVCLSFEHREVLSLRFSQELSVKEVALLLGIPAGTVKSRTFQALHRLRQYLETASFGGEVSRGDYTHG
jgi:RNA polymerase sigma-70 factor, ECF subfamily